VAPVRSLNALPGQGVGKSSAFAPEPHERDLDHMPPAQPGVR
jgi:hypothetical protein